jgi:hypothetical protein
MARKGGQEEPTSVAEEDARVVLNHFFSHVASQKASVKFRDCVGLDHVGII